MPNERVVYVLGAGFSAPYGLPLMRNFLNKAKDQLAKAQSGSRQLKSVFEEIDQLAKVKNYFESDLLNVEEIFSLLEMNAQLNLTPEPPQFSSFIRDVILHYTPAHPEPPDLTGGMNYDHLFGQSAVGAAAAFVGNLFRLDARLIGTSQGSPAPPVRATSKRDGEFAYDVVSFNYDTVLEDAASYLGRVFSIPIEFARAQEADGTSPRLAKLHGSVDGSSPLVPPTWSKGVAGKVLPEWQLAYRLLSEATQVRFIGYSLAPGDTYAQYLFKSAALRSARLKQIDAICLDRSKTVEGRFKSLFTFRDFRFADSDAIDYCSRCVKRSQFFGPAMTFDQVESVHDRLMG